MKNKFFHDILRDKNSNKFSITKFSAFIVLIIAVISFFVSLIIMVLNKEIDHILIGELIALLLTLLGYKNSFGSVAKINNDNVINKELIKNKNLSNLVVDADINKDDFIKEKEINDEIG